MDSRSNDIGSRLRHLEEEFEREAARQRTRWQYRIERNRVHFERHVSSAHRRLRTSLLRFLRQSSVPNLLTAPLIYSLFVPLVLMDAWILAYQLICFPIYRIPHVPRRQYLVFDRHRLGYLNAIEKFNCLYCSYANGLFAYFREVAARTEQYWCPIKHASAVRQPHPRYHGFVDYGDAAGYHERLQALRASWTPALVDAATEASHPEEANDLRRGARSASVPSSR